MAQKVQKMYHKTWQKKDFLKMFQFSEKIGQNYPASFKLCELIFDHMIRCLEEKMEAVRRLH